MSIFKSFCRILADVGTRWIVILDNTGLRASTPADVPKNHTRTRAYIVDSQWKGGPPWSSAARHAGALMIVRTVHHTECPHVSCGLSCRIHVEG